MIFYVSRSFNISPHVVESEWSYVMLLDAIENIEVNNEVERMVNNNG